MRNHIDAARVRHASRRGGGGVADGGVGAAGWVREGIAKLGWAEGRNLRIDLRYGGGLDPNRLHAIAASDQIASVDYATCLSSGR
jgi:hypothetical protein